MLSIDCCCTLIEQPQDYIFLVTSIPTLLLLLLLLVLQFLSLYIFYSYYHRKCVCLGTRSSLSYVNMYCKQVFHVINSHQNEHLFFFLLLS